MEALLGFFLLSLPPIINPALPCLESPRLPSISCPWSHFVRRQAFPALPCVSLLKCRRERTSPVPLPHLDLKSQCRDTLAPMPSTWQGLTRRKEGLVDCPQSLPTALSPLWPTEKHSTHRGTFFSRHASEKVAIWHWVASNTSAWWTAGTLSICRLAPWQDWKIIITWRSRGETSSSRRPLVQLDLLFFRFRLWTCYRWAYRK